MLVEEQAPLPPTDTDPAEMAREQLNVIIAEAIDYVSTGHHSDMVQLACPADIPFKLAVMWAQERGICPPLNLTTGERFFQGAFLSPQEEGSIPDLYRTKVL